MMAEGSRIELMDDARNAIAFQQYGRAPEIDGARYVELRKNRAEEGWFTEIFRLGSTGEVRPMAEESSWPLRQLSASWAEPGRMNAFHIHPRRGQNEYWTVLHGQLRVWLVDCRKGSPTAGARRGFVLAGEAPGRLCIPAGVAHGYRAGIHGGLLVYGMDQQFDAEDPDEGRLPWDFFGSDLWERETG